MIAVAYKIWDCTMLSGQPVLVFDIETQTDLKTAQHLYGLDLPTASARAAVAKLRRQSTGTDFPQLPLHEIVCISGLWCHGDGIKLFSWTQQNYTEQQLLEKFVGIFEQHQPILVSWNGTQFDMAVIMQRCLYHGITAAALFDQGEHSSPKRHNNYQSRYQLRHTDLVDVLANFNIRQFQKLDDMAQMLGYPGQRGVEQYAVEQQVEAGDWQAISAHCEGDVLNTWLIYLRWLLLRGFIKPQQHRQWIEISIAYLQKQPQQQHFLALWQECCKSTVFTENDFLDC